MDLSISSYHARQGWQGSTQRSCPGFLTSDIQALILRHKTCLCFRRWCACIETEHTGMAQSIPSYCSAHCVFQRERREKKSGAAANHAKLAEKLLAAQMRREALGRVHPDDSSYVRYSSGCQFWLTWLDVTAQPPQKERNWTITQYISRTSMPRSRRLLQGKSSLIRRHHQKRTNSMSMTHIDCPISTWKRLLQMLHGQQCQTPVLRQKRNSEHLSRTCALKILMSLHPLFANFLQKCSMR